MRFSVSSPIFGCRPVCALLRTGALAAGLACVPVAPVCAADDAGRSYPEARRRADLEHSEAQRECARMAPELKADCLARGKAHHEVRMAAARERFPDVAPPPLDPETAARFERELTDCDRVPGNERAGCRLDVKRRYRH